MSERYIPYDPASYQSVPTLAPSPLPYSRAAFSDSTDTEFEPKGYPPSQASPAGDAATQAMEAARKKSGTPDILVLTLSVTAVVLIPAVVLMAYIMSIHSADRDGRHIITTASLQNVLTIAQVLSTVVTMTVPLVMSVHAFQLAAQWLKATQARTTANEPSPMQLGILISVLQGSNILTWLKARLHLSRLTKDSKRQNLSNPPILTRAALVLGMLLGLSYSISALDTWFHLSSETFLVTATSPYPDISSATFGRQVNETNCAYWKSKFQEADLCGMITDATSDPFTYSAPQAMRTVTNTSSVDTIAITNDNHAIIVPPVIPEIMDSTYTAVTFGVQTACESITTRCLPGPDVPYVAASPEFNCVGSPLVNLSIYPSGNVLIGVTDPSNGSYVAQDSSLGPFNYAVANTNPFPTVAIVESKTYEPANLTSDWSFTNNTGFVYHNDLSYNVLYCNSTVREIIYEYSASGYRVLGSNMAPVVMATRAASGLDFPGTMRRIADRVDGVGISSGDYVDSFALEMSREMLAMTSFIYESQPVLSIKSSRLVSGSRLDLIPLALTVLAVFAYAIATLIIGIAALLETRGTSFVRLVHLRITNSMALVHTSFGRAQPERTWEDDGAALFCLEREQDRLSVGTTVYNTFGISRMDQVAYH